jgi:hypothetical protein
MSFSWITNSWGGPANASDFYPGSRAFTQGPSSAVVTASFPDRPLHTQQIPQSRVHSFDYQVPNWLLLKDMAVNKTPLAIQRGGYSGVPPTVEPILHSSSLDLSARYYNQLGANIRGPILLGTYGPL